MTDQISTCNTQSALSRTEIVRLRNEMAADLNSKGYQDRNNIITQENFNDGNLFNTDIGQVG